MTELHTPALERARAAAIAVLAAAGLDADLSAVHLVHDDTAATVIPAATGLSRLGARGVDERFLFTVDDSGQNVIRVHSAEAAFRALIRHALDPAGTLARGADGPRYAWRGLSVDLVRWAMPLDALFALVDLVALHGINVLHLHLTDHQGWRAPVPKGVSAAQDRISPEDFKRLCNYAEESFVTIVPELDMPGHTAGLVALMPELYAGRDTPIHPFLTWLDPKAPAVRDTVASLIAEMAALTPGPYLHLGGDEAFGMPQESFAEFMELAVELVLLNGKLPLAWQETARSGASVHAAQAWTAVKDLPGPGSIVAQLPPELEELGRSVEVMFAEAEHDAGKLAAAGIPLIISQQDPLYLDRKYSDASTDDGQNLRMESLGFPAYEPAPTRSVWDFDPASSEAVAAGGEVAGVEAAIWCETVNSIEDFSLLLLPRLGLFGERSWRREANPALPGSAWFERSRAAWRALGFPEDYRGSSLTGHFGESHE